MCNQKRCEGVTLPRYLLTHATSHRLLRPPFSCPNKAVGNQSVRFTGIQNSPTINTTGRCYQLGLVNECSRNKTKSASSVLSRQGLTGVVQECHVHVLPTTDTGKRRFHAWEISGHELGYSKQWISMTEDFFRPSISTCVPRLTNIISICFSYHSHQFRKLPCGARQIEGKDCHIAQHHSASGPSACGNIT